MRSRRVLAAAMLVLFLGACSKPDSARATEIYADCLERNGIEAEGVEVKLNSDGTVASISERWLTEVDTDFAVTVRLGCTAEVEASQ